MSAVFLGRCIGLGGRCSFTSVFTVMDQTVDRGGRGHWVLEDLLPLRERQIARQQHAATFVTLGQEREQDFHLLTSLLHVADVVDDQCVALRVPTDHSREFQVSLRDQQFLDQQTARGKVNLSPLSDQLLAEAAEQMRFTGPASSEDEDVLSAVEEVAADERLHLAAHLPR